MVAYQVKAARYDSIDRVMSERSGIVSVKSILKAPVIKQLSNLDTQIKLKWNAVESATSYEVYRSAKQEGSYQRVVKTKNTSCIDKSIKKNITYYYKVRALREYQKDTYYSDFSDIVRN